jgi:hypothetical protein
LNILHQADLDQCSVSVGGHIARDARQPRSFGGPEPTFAIDELIAARLRWIWPHPQTADEALLADRLG